MKREDLLKRTHRCVAMAACGIVVMIVPLANAGAAPRPLTVAQVRAECLPSVEPHEEADANAFIQDFLSDLAKNTDDYLREFETNHAQEAESNEKIKLLVCMVKQELALRAGGASDSDAESGNARGMTEAAGADEGSSGDGNDRFEVEQGSNCLEYELLPDAIGREWFQVRNICGYPVLFGISVNVSGRVVPGDGMGMRDPGLAPREVAKHPYGFIVGKLSNGQDEPWHAVIDWVCPTKAEVRRRTGKDVAGVQWSAARKACIAILEPEGGGVAN